MQNQNMKKKYFFVRNHGGERWKWDIYSDYGFIDRIWVDWFNGNERKTTASYNFHLVNRKRTQFPSKARFGTPIRRLKINESIHMIIIIH